MHLPLRPCEDEGEVDNFVFDCVCDCDDDDDCGGGGDIDGDKEEFVVG